MINKILEMIVCGGFVALELLVIIGIALLIQLVVYQGTRKKINLYKIITYNLIEKFL